MSSLQLTVGSPALISPYRNKPLKDVLLLPATKRSLKRPDRMIVRFMSQNINELLKIAFLGGNEPETIAAQQVLMLENPTIIHSVLIDGFLTEFANELLKSPTEINQNKFSTFISVIEFGIITFPETSATTLTFFPELVAFFDDYRVDMMMSKIFKPQAALASFYNFIESSNFVDLLISNKAFKVLSYTQKIRQLLMSDEQLEKVLVPPEGRNKDHWMLLEQLSQTDIANKMGNLVSCAIIEIDERNYGFLPSQVSASNLISNIMVYDNIVSETIDPVILANLLVKVYDTNPNHTIALTSANSLVISALTSKIVRPQVCLIFFRFLSENLTSNRRILVAFLTCLTEKITLLCKTDREISSELMSTYYSKVFVDSANEIPSDPEEILSGYSHSARLNIIPFDAA